MSQALIETNLVIAVFDQDGTTDSTIREQARSKLQSLIEHNITPVITPLIRYEVLRGIKWHEDERYQTVSRFINSLPVLDITAGICDLATQLYRFKVKVAAPEQKVDKLKFDIFHLASAKCYGIDLISHDSDIAKLEQLYLSYQAEINHS